MLWARGPVPPVFRYGAKFTQFLTYFKAFFQTDFELIAARLGMFSMAFPKRAQKIEGNSAIFVW